MEDPVVDNPTANLIALLETSRSSAEALLADADEYSAKQLHRHIHAMDQQIAVVNGTAIYDRKGKQHNAPIQ